MTTEEIQIRIVRQELANMLTCWESYGRTYGWEEADFLETIIDRVIDLQEYLANGTQLPEVYVYPWHDVEEAE